MSPRIPSRHDMPLEPLVMNEEDVVNFQIAIASGFGGQAQWRRRGNHERLDLWMHPDAHNYLPEGVTVEATGRRYNPDGHIQFRLIRDYDSAALHVVRSGVRKETEVWTSTPEDQG